MMRRILFLLTLVVLGITSSCSDFLDITPDNIPTINNAFTDKYNAEKYLFTCYSYLPKMADVSQNPALLGSDELSRDPYFGPGGTSEQRGVMLSLGYQKITDPYFNYWEGANGGQALYAGIRTCNTFLERIGSVPGMNSYEVKTWAAEAKFIKAYLHFYLIRMYGPITIFRESIPVSESLDQIKQFRDPLDSCFSYVVQLLDEAIKDLPLFYESLAKDYGRINAVIALSVKAQVLLTAASPLFNGQWGYQIYNNDGKPLFPKADPTLIAAKWKKAVAACDSAVVKAESTGFRLYTVKDFKEIGAVSDSTKMKVILNYRMTEPDDNPEVIWPHTNSRASGYQSSALPQYFTKQDWLAEGNNGVPLKISLMYYTKNGVPIEEDKDWKHVDLNKVETMSSGSDNLRDHRFYLKRQRSNVRRNLYREARFYSDLAFDGTLVYGHRRTYSTDDQTSSNFNSYYVNIWNGGWSVAGYASRKCPFGYWPQKVIGIDSGHDDSYWMLAPYAFPAMRLADLYLMYAEALIETDDLANAKVYIDKVRNRAGLEGVDDAWSKYSTNPSKPSTKDGLRDILHRERMIEMAFEGSRFWDLRRWLEARTQCNVPVQAWSSKGVSTAAQYYQMETIYYPSFTDKDYFFPIPETQLTRNPNLVQNVGW